MTKHYDEYKESGVEWLGRVPSHWKVDRISGKCIKNKNKNKFDIEKNLLSLSYGNIIKKDIEKSFGLMPDSFSTYQIVEENFTILRLTDLQNDKKSLRVGLVKEKGIITSAYLGLICKNNLNPVYFNYLMKAYDEIKLFYGLGDGIRATLTYSDIKELRIPIPPKKEQDEIVLFIDKNTSKIDSAVAELEKQKSLLIELKKSTIHQAVTKGLDLTVPMKDSGVEWIGEIPSHWNMKRIKDKLINLGGGKYGEDEGKLELDIPCISISDFRNGNISTNQKIKMKRSYSISNIMKKGTLLVEKSGGGEKNPVGRVIMIEKDIEAYYTNFVASLKTLENEKFCYYLMKNIHNRRVHMPFVKQNTGLQNFDYNGFSLFQKVAFPSKLEQNDIVSYLDKKTGQIDQSIEVIDNQIAKMKEYKKTLINDVVTGKIKVVD